MTRTLIYAMQSSGASAYAFNLGRMASQRGKTLCIPDLWNPYLAPRLSASSADHIILKVVVSNRYTLDQHIKSFDPTETFLFRRNREANAISLGSKMYANESGDMDFKFSLFDIEISRNRFPVIEYESMPWLPITQYELNAMLLNNTRLSLWAGDTMKTQWGFGGIRTT